MMTPGPGIKPYHYCYAGSYRPFAYMPYYNSAYIHRKPNTRQLRTLLDYWDDMETYKLDYMPADMYAPIVRGEIARILNIETLAIRQLRIKLYHAEEKDDVDVVLELGKAYEIKYVTEGGVKTAVGILKGIDSSIPDTVCRYVGEFNEQVITAWIAMDCSTTANSDKRKIYIASIRDIKEIELEGYEAEEVDPSNMSDTQKLSYLVNLFPEIANKIEEILLKVVDNNDILNEIKDMDYPQKIDYIMNLLYNHIGENLLHHFNQQRGINSALNIPIEPSAVENEYKMPPKFKPKEKPTSNTEEPTNSESTENKDTYIW